METVGKADPTPPRLQLDKDRCAVCGWLLQADITQGCVRGNCSQRPLPGRFYDLERANVEYGEDMSRFIEPPSALERENAELRAELTAARLAQQEAGLRARQCFDMENDALCKLEAAESRLTETQNRLDVLNEMITLQPGEAFPRVAELAQELHETKDKLTEVEQEAMNRQLAEAQANKRADAADARAGEAIRQLREAQAIDAERHANCPNCGCDYRTALDLRQWKDQPELVDQVDDLREQLASATRSRQTLVEQVKRLDVIVNRIEGWESPMTIDEDITTELIMDAKNTMQDVLRAALSHADALPSDSQKP